MKWSKNLLVVFSEKLEASALKLQMHNEVMIIKIISFAIKAANALDLQPLPSSYLCLFKAAGGAVIANKEIMVNKKLRPWSLGNYLSLLKKSPSNVKIGVAYVFDDLNKSEEFSKSSEPEDPPHSVKLEAVSLIHSTFFGVIQT